MGNTIGVHALVWVGGWSPDEARKAISSTREAGSDPIGLTMPDVDPSRADLAAQPVRETDLGAALPRAVTPLPPQFVGVRAGAPHGRGKGRGRLRTPPRTRTAATVWR